MHFYRQNWSKPLCSRFLRLTSCNFDAICLYTMDIGYTYYTQYNITFRFLYSQSNTFFHIFFGAEQKKSESPDMDSIMPRAYIIFLIYRLYQDKTWFNLFIQSLSRGKKWIRKLNWSNLYVFIQILHLHKIQRDILVFNSTSLIIMIIMIIRQI